MNKRSLRRIFATAVTTATVFACLTAGVAAPASAAPTQDAAHVTQSITLPLTSPRLANDLGPWGTGYITFCCGIPVGGYASLTIRADGTYQFSGHFHVSGWPSYNDSFVWVVAASDGTAFSFAHRGHMAGTGQSGSRDDDWNNTGYNESVASHWNALQNHWRYNWRAKVNWDVAGAIGQIIDALKALGQVVAVIITVV